MSFAHNFFAYRSGILTCEDVNLTHIIERVGTPVYVYSKQALLFNLKKLQNGLEGLDYQICFAIKANSNLAVIKLLSEAGAGVDAVSGGELFRAHQVNVPHKKILFSGIGKTVQEMKEGLQYQNKGIYSFNIESVAEIMTLNRVAKEMNVKAPVALRFNPDVDPKTHPYISTGMKKNKFGLEKNEILNVVSKLKELSHIQLKGISIHIGSQLLSLAPLQEAFESLATLIDKIPHPIEFLDLGGGLGIAYQKNEIPIAVSDYCGLIQKMFGKESRFKGQYKIILEPGRLISGNAGVLLTQILYRKSKRTHDFLIVDAAMNDLIRPALYGSYHEIYPLEETFLQDNTKKTSVVGSVCESADFLGKNRDLSIELKTGDYLAVLSAGAYGFTMASQYNSRPLISEVLVDEHNFKIVRKRQSYADLIAAEIF